jgi:hypothetical protein
MAATSCGLVGVVAQARSLKPGRAGFYYGWRVEFIDLQVEKSQEALVAKFFKSAWLFSRSD